jgi:hypothetical protein
MEKDNRMEEVMESELRTIGGTMYECRPLLVTRPEDGGMVVLCAMG